MVILHLSQKIRYKKTKPLTEHSFTLVELLVVISILAIFMSLLFPSLSRTIYTAENLKCLNDKKSLSQATLMFCDDNGDLYPHRDRGALISGRYPSTVRKGNNTPGQINYSLPYALGPYLAGGIYDPAMTCPLYTGKGFGNEIDTPGYEHHGKKCYVGGKKGCLIHGATHTKNGVSALNFYGGLEKYAIPYAYVDHFPLYNRKRLGDPYVIKIGNDIHELSILWADVLGPVGRPTGGTPAAAHFYQMFHEPPPGSIYELAPRWNDGVEGLLYVYSLGGGGMGINYSYDDGSAKSIQLPAIPKYGAHWSWRKSYYSEWYIYSPYAHQLYPKE
jgi:prepilin-type N-terminal cleavage/methylation domain-containing protein